MKKEKIFSKALKTIAEKMADMADDSISIFCVYQPKEYKKPECLKKNKKK